MARADSRLHVEGKHAEALMGHRVGHKVDLRVRGRIAEKHESDPNRYNPGAHIIVEVERVRHNEGLPSPKSRPKRHHTQL